LKFSFSQVKCQLALLWSKGAFYIFMGSFLTKFVAFFGSIFLVRVLSKDSYGVLSYIENIYGYVYIFAGMGLMNALLRYVVLGKTPEEKHGYYRYALKKGTLFNIILVSVVAVSGMFYPHPEKFESAQWLLVIMLMALPFQHLIDDNVYTYRAMFENIRYAVTALVTSSFLIISRYVGARYWDLGGVVFAIIAANILFGISLCLIVYKLYFKGIRPTSLSKAEKKIVDKYSLQYMITNGLWAIFMLNDVFLMGRLCGDPAILADYKVAYVLPGNLAIISTAIGIFVGPYFIRHEADYRWVRKSYLKTFLISAVLIGLAVLVLFIFAKPIITLLYGAQYENTVPIMRLLLVAAFANCALRFTTAHILASMGQIKYNMIISFIGILLQIGINIAIIPIYGAYGAACTSIAVYTFMAVMLFIIFAKKYKLFGVKA